MILVIEYKLEFASVLRCMSIRSTWHLELNSLNVKGLETRPFLELDNLV